jgi:hypothetical protein
MVNGKVSIIILSAEIVALDTVKAVFDRFYENAQGNFNSKGKQK